MESASYVTFRLTCKVDYHAEAIATYSSVTRQCHPVEKNMQLRRVLGLECILSAQSRQIRLHLLRAQHMPCHSDKELSLWFAYGSTRRKF